jgi:hypothetical protein
MAECNFDNPELTCPLCGFDIRTIGGDATWLRECPENTAPAPPSVPRRLANFTLASIAHVLRGSPTCSQEQIDQRHAICMGCELYIPDPNNRLVGVCSHKSCGCEVTRQDKFVSKLAWADQQCPLAKWPKLVD